MNDDVNSVVTLANDSAYMVEGRHLGRPYGTSYQKLQKQHDKLMNLLDKGLTKAEIARSLGCSWLTVHRYMQRNLN